MPDEIILEDQGLVIYRSEEPGPAVPYVGAVRPDSINHGFANLRDEPQLIPTIPEAQNSPGLMAIVVASNDPDGRLMSIGCEHALNAIEPPNHGLAFYYHSYTNIAFFDAALNLVEDNLVRLAKAITDRAQVEQPPPRFRFEIGIERMRKFFDHPGQHYCLDLGLSGYGRTPQEASHAYEVAAAATAIAIRKAGALDWNS